jgi:hypothetical protein
MNINSYQMAALKNNIKTEINNVKYRKQKLELNNY